MPFQVVDEAYAHNVKNARVPEDNGSGNFQKQDQVFGNQEISGSRGNVTQVSLISPQMVRHINLYTLSDEVCMSLSG